MKIFDLNAEIVNWSSNSDWKSDRRKQRKVTSKKWQGSLITAYFQLREAASLLFLNHWVCGSAIKPVVVKWRRRRALFVLDSRLVAEYSPFGPYARGATCFFFFPRDLTGKIVDRNFCDQLFLPVNFCNRAKLSFQNLSCSANRLDFCICNLFFIKKVSLTIIECFKIGGNYLGGSFWSSCNILILCLVTRYVEPSFMLRVKSDNVVIHRPKRC